MSDAPPWAHYSIAAGMGTIAYLLVSSRQERWEQAVQRHIPRRLQRNIRSRRRLRRLINRVVRLEKRDRKRARGSHDWFLKRAEAIQRYQDIAAKHGVAITANEALAWSRTGKGPERFYEAVRSEVGSWSSWLIPALAYAF